MTGNPGGNGQPGADARVRVGRSGAGKAGAEKSDAKSSAGKSSTGKSSTGKSRAAAPSPLAAPSLVALSIAASAADACVGPAPVEDVLSQVLRVVRLSGSVQFCFMSAGAWQTEDSAAMAEAGGGRGIIPFHIAVAGQCWVRAGERRAALAAGDVVALPHGDSHQLGAGDDGRQVLVLEALPPPPWREVPVLRFGGGRARQVQLLCGYVQCEAMAFAPLRQALPSLMLARGQGASGAWLRAAIAQMAAEVERPRSGGRSVLERLTELVFIELLRQQILRLRPDSTGWLKALGDPALGRCLSLVHEAPYRDWDVAALARGCGLSRSTLMERFEALLRTSPMRYVRAWRLCLAGMALEGSDRPIAAIAHEAGYGTEAAFSRAFARAHGAPPAAWRQRARMAAG